MQSRTHAEVVDRFFTDLKSCNCSDVFAKFFTRISPEGGELDLEAVKKYFKTCSSGEKIMLSFFGNIFLGRDEYELKLTQAVGRLDETNRLIIAKWMANPYWP